LIAKKTNCSLWYKCYANLIKGLIIYKRSERTICEYFAKEES
jgi:hypothetical protein